MWCRARKAQRRRTSLDWAGGRRAAGEAKAGVEAEEGMAVGAVGAVGMVADEAAEGVRAITSSHTPEHTVPGVWTLPTR